MRKLMLQMLMLGGAVIGLLLVLGTSATAWTGAATQFTDNSGEDGNPVVSGSNVAWQCDDLGGDWEICFWDGDTVTQITHNGINDSRPAISGSDIVWHARDGSTENDYEIYYWDGATTTQLTDNGVHDWDPGISGSKVVWSGHDGNDYEIYLWNGVTTTNISNNSTHDFNPRHLRLERGVDGRGWERRQ